MWFADPTFGIDSACAAFGVPEHDGRKLIGPNGRVEVSDMRIERVMIRKWRLWILATAIAVPIVQLSACAIASSHNSRASVHEAAVPVPGGSTYSWGWSQKPEDSVQVERAQSGLRMRASAPRTWFNVSINRLPQSGFGALRAYYPLHARWKLRDGREFLVDEVDTAGLMREYWRANSLSMQWQREGRARDPVGDFDPLLAHEVKGDELRIKWIVILNKTPVSQRLGVSGAARSWRLEYEEHLLAVIKGRATSGINFSILEDPRQ